MTHQELIVWPRNKWVILSLWDFQVLLLHHSPTFPDTLTNFKHQYVRCSILLQLWETNSKANVRWGWVLPSRSIYYKQTHLYQTYTCFGHEMRFPFLSAESPPCLLAKSPAKGDRAAMAPVKAKAGGKTWLWEMAEWGCSLDYKHSHRR